MVIFKFELVKVKKNDSIVCFVHHSAQPKFVSKKRITAKQTVILSINYKKQGNTC